MVDWSLCRRGRQRAGDGEQKQPRQERAGAGKAHIGGKEVAGRPGKRPPVRVARCATAQVRRADPVSETIAAGEYGLRRRGPAERPHDARRSFDASLY